MVKKRGLQDTQLNCYPKMGLSRKKKKNLSPICSVWVGYQPICIRFTQINEIYKDPIY